MRQKTSKDGVNCKKILKKKTLEFNQKKQEKNIRMKREKNI